MVSFQIVIVGALLALAGRVVYEYRRTIKRDYVLHEHHPGKCNIVNGIDHGSEDIALVPGTSFAIITNGLRVGYHPEMPEGGALYIFDFARPEAGAQKLQFTNFDADKRYFIPHGLKIWPTLPTASSPGGAAAQQQSSSLSSSSTQHAIKVSVYVVNHHQNNRREQVDKFEFDTAKPNQVHYVKSFADPNFKGMINSVAVVGDDKFYWTNFLPHFNTPILNLLPPLEVWLGAPLGSVGYYDGKNGEIVASGHLAPNGIAASHDLSTVYVVDTHNGYLYTYARGAGASTQQQQRSSAQSRKTMAGNVNAYNGSLSLVSKNYTAYGILDNIWVDEKGDLLIGTNPGGHGMWNFVYGMFIHRRLESQVLKVLIDSKTLVPSETRELFSDNAKLLNAGSTALTYGGGRAMLVGSVMDKLVYCECSHNQC